MSDGYNATAPDASSVKELTLGVPVTARTTKGEYAFFKVQRKDVSKLLTIEALPANARSDPDLYVSVGLTPTTAKGNGLAGDGAGLATKTSYTWKSCLVGRDRVDVHPTDSKAVAGWYTIGVLGYTDVTDFVVSAVELDPPTIKPLNDKFPTNDRLRVGTRAYYHLTINDKERATVFVRCKARGEKDVVGLFASSDVMYPHADLCRWKAIGKPGEGVFIEFDSHDFKYGKAECYVAIEAIAPDADVVPTQTQGGLSFATAAAAHDAATKTAAASTAGSPAPNSPPPAEQTPAPNSPAPTETAAGSAAGHTESADGKSKAVGAASPVPAGVSIPTLASGPDVMEFAVVVQTVLEEDMLTPELSALFGRFKRLYTGVDGGRVSQSERKRDEHIANSKSFTYGEITFPTFSGLLDVCKPKPGEVFYDLGCGTGKPVFAAHYLAPFAKCIGVELLPGLYQVCESLLKQYHSDPKLWKTDGLFEAGSKPKITAGAPDTTTASAAAAAAAAADGKAEAGRPTKGATATAGSLHFVCEDMAAIEWWRDADVVYTSSICFEESLFAPLTKQMESMKSGARLITLKMPDSPHFEVLEKGWFKMSWGRCTVYVLKRK